MFFKTKIKKKLFQGQKDLNVTLDVMNYRGFLKSFGCFFQLFHRCVRAEFNQSMKALKYLSMASMVTYLCIHVIVYLCNCICCKCISPKHGQHWYVSFQSASKRCKNVGGARFSFLAHSAASEEKKSHNI